MHAYSSYSLFVGKGTYVLKLSSAAAQVGIPSWSSRVARPSLMLKRRRGVERETPRRSTWMLVHPQDMGRPARGGQGVGSIWLWREVDALRGRRGCTLVAWNRCERDLADNFAKPWLLTNLLGAGRLGVEAWMQLDGRLNYLGPLPVRRGHDHVPSKGSPELKAIFIRGRNWIQELTQVILSEFLSRCTPF